MVTGEGWENGHAEDRPMVIERNGFDNGVADCRGLVYKKSNGSLYRGCAHFSCSRTVYVHNVEVTTLASSKLEG